MSKLTDEYKEIYEKDEDFKHICDLLFKENILDPVNCKHICAIVMIFQRGQMSGFREIIKGNLTCK